MRRSHLAAPLLFAILASAACGPAAPAPVEVTKSAPAKAAAPAAPAPAPKQEPVAAATPTPRREPPLTPEEIELIESDSKTLSPEQNRKRAHALRRKIMQNPDSPQAQQLEQLRRDVESGALVPVVKPEGGSTPADKSLKLESRASSGPAPDSEKAP